MLILSTTAEFCQGDDFIRDGVRRLLDVAPMEGELWVNRFGVRGGGGNVWRVLRNMPTPGEAMQSARALVMAGTPGWGKPERGWYDAARQNGKPVWLVGIGGSGKWKAGELAPYAPSIQVASVRDVSAHRALDRAGIACQQFLDPAFHAPYMAPGRKTLDTVLTYKAPTKQDSAAAVREAYRALATKFAPRIQCVLVHECSEIAEAHALFGVEPFFSHEPRRYVDIYRHAAHYIGGRFHGAVATLATGGTASLLYSPKNEKVCGLSPHAWLPVACHAFEGWEQVELDADGDDVQAHIQADFAAHSAYLRARIE